MSQTIDGFYAGRDKVDSQIRYLRHLSDAFLNTGNKRMSDDLTFSADALEEGLDQMRTAFHSQVTGRANDAWAASGNMVSAALAVAEANKGGKK